MFVLSLADGKTCCCGLSLFRVLQDLSRSRKTTISVFILDYEKLKSKFIL